MSLQSPPLIYFTTYEVRPHFTIAAQPSAVVTVALDYTHITPDLSSLLETLSTTSLI